ncbi:hypothetical protein KFK09_013844 [Dendrobium nobile]|uniref:VQ domain-containing protein n=1 Tax=Dendrobium nobile TaxID=94219 RepID=A0A8T3BBB6_DENNO|nr:hypothetical protein KFK09_013844 [Dendrobium nobile]
MPPYSSKTSSSSPIPRATKEYLKLRRPSSPRALSPVIVQMEPMRIIHVQPHEFMPLVQKLTGKSSPAATEGASAMVPVTMPSSHALIDINVAYVGDDDESIFCE